MCSINSFEISEDLPMITSVCRYFQKYFIFSVVVREPANIVIHKDSSTSLTILWSPPLIPGKDVEIKGYQVYMM